MTITWPVLSSRIRVPSGGLVLQVREDAVTNLSVTIPEGDYYLYGDGSESGDLCTVLSDEISDESLASGAGRTYTVAYTASIDPSVDQGRTGSVTIDTDGTHVQLLTSGTTFDLELLGFPQSSDTSAEPSLSSTLSPKSVWVPGQPLVEEYDDAPVAEGFVHRSPGKTASVYLAADVTRRRRLLLDLIAEERVRNNHTAAATGSDRYRAFYHWWEYARSRPLRLYHGAESGSSGTLSTLDSGDLLGTYLMDDHVSEPPEMTHDDSRLYTGVLNLREVTG